MRKLDERYLTPGIKTDADNLHIHFRRFIDRLVINASFKPGEAKTTKAILAAMKYFSRSNPANFELWYLPKKYITKEIVWGAPYGNSADIEYVPNEFKTKSLYLHILKKDPTGCIFEYMEKKYWSEKLLVMALKINGMYLGLLPKSIRSYKLSTLAVKNNGLALQFVPNKIKDEKLTVLAIKQNQGAVIYQKNAKSTFAKLVDQKISSLSPEEKIIMKKIMMEALNKSW